MAFREAFGDIYTPEEIAGYCATAYRPDDIPDDPDIAVFLAEDRGGVVGHVKLGPLNLPVDADPEVPAREVKRLYVLRRGQGRGIARTLLDLAIIDACGKGAHALYLSCWTGNERALRFYQRHGFVIVGHNQFMVGNRADDDHILRLDL